MTEKDFQFEYEFQSNLGDIGDLEDKLRGESETRLLRLSRGKTDITGASVIIENVNSGSTSTAYLFRARVVAYTRPEHIAAVKEADTAQAALKGALDAVERQVREKRGKMRDRKRQLQEEAADE